MRDDGIAAERWRNEGTGLTLRTHFSPGCSCEANLWMKGHLNLFHLVQTGVPLREFFQRRSYSNVAVEICGRGVRKGEPASVRFSKHHLLELVGTFLLCSSFCTVVLYCTALHTSSSPLLSPFPTVHTRPTITTTHLSDLPSITVSPVAACSQWRQIAPSLSRRSATH